MKQTTLHFLFLFLLASCTQQQNEVVEKIALSKPFIIGAVDSIQSLELMQTRTLNIYLPDGYSADSALTYPVIYLLDGSANEDFIHTVGLVQFQTMIGTMQPAIVVGIANVDRKHDFTFPTNNAQDKLDFPTTGGSEKFIGFIEKELQPYVSKKYKTNHIKTIVGQSLGGLLASEILLKKPQMFTNFIIVSPSLWWDDESLLKQAPELIAKNVYSNRKIFITVGNEDDQMETEAKQLDELLNDATGGDWSHSFYPMPDEDHLTILHNALYKAFPIMLPRLRK